MPSERYYLVRLRRRRGPLALAAACGIATCAVCLAVSLAFPVALLLGIVAAGIAYRARA